MTVHILHTKQLLSKIEAHGIVLAMSRTWWFSDKTIVNGYRPNPGPNGEVGINYSVDLISNLRESQPIDPSKVQYIPHNCPTQHFFTAAWVVRHSTHRVRGVRPRNGRQWYHARYPQPLCKDNPLQARLSPRIRRMSDENAAVTVQYPFIKRILRNLERF